MRKTLFPVFRNPRPLIVLAVISLVLLAYIDWITGPNVAVTCFYLIPVFILSWFCGPRVGCLVAVFHSIIWFIIDLERLPIHSPLPYWNAFVQFVTFAAVVWLIHICRHLTGEVAHLDKAKAEALQRQLEIQTEAAAAIHRLASQLSAAEDAQRRHLGQELHDSFGQSLMVLKLQLESLAGKFTPTQSQAADLDAALGVVTSLIRQTRTITFELYPSMLDQLGLATTLRQYAQQLSTHVNARINVAYSGHETPLTPETASFLFRGVKELITNALKHGAADDIVIQIRAAADEIRVVVNDNGRGFDPASAAPAGIGLAWIRERLRTLGGSSTMESAPGQGARIIMALPLNPH